MLNFLMQRQHESFPLAPFLKIFLVSMGTNKAVAIHPSHQHFLSLFSPKLLRPPPFKNGKISLVKITFLTSGNHIVFCEVWTSFTLGHNVINRKLFSPFAAICTSTLPQWPSQEIVFKNTLAKSTFCISRAKFNERIQQLIRTIRSWHGAFQLSCRQSSANCSFVNFVE